MSATINDIAKKCHVSTATVSKVFNNTGKISVETTKLIKDTAKEMGYFPRASARFIARGRKYSKLIGVYLEINDNKGISHELFSKILNSFRIEAEKSNYDICFISRGNKNVSYMNKIESHGCCGVFCLCALDKEERITELEKNNIPVVAFDYTEAKLSVTSNNQESVGEMVDYLVNMGHKRIVYVYPDEADISKNRYSGFVEALKRNNIEFDTRMVVKASYFTEKSAETATDLALKSGINPTVIMYPDDYTAINAIPYLKKLGYKVPKDISVTGFDGIDVVSIMRPKITTIRQDTEQMGVAAAKLLLNAIENEKELNENTCKIIPSKLMKGESVKCLLDEEGKNET